MRIPMRNPYARMIASRLAVLGVALLLAGCQAVTIDEDPDAFIGLGSVRQVFDDGLVQQVSITPVAPFTGSTVEIRSVLRNATVRPYPLGSRICGLTYGDRTLLDDPPGLARCAGYSMTRDLGPGDSIVVVDRMQVIAGPGTHTLRVQHAVSPARWVELTLAVQQP
jgi:hypothetical protein